MKRITIILLLLILLSSCSHQTTKLKIIKEQKASCLISENPNINTFLEKGQSLNLTGDNCSINLKLVGTDYNSIKIRTNENKTFEIYDDEPKYFVSGFYLHLINVYENGARIAINKKITYNESKQFQKFFSCFTNPECKLSCNDFDGLHNDECENNTIEASKTPFRNKINDSKNCCINYPNTYYVLPSQRVYNRGESMKLFFMGPKSQPCSITLTSRENKNFSAGNTMCKPFSQIASKNLYSSYGEYYGSWIVDITLPLRFGKPWHLKTRFNYVEGRLIYKELTFIKTIKFNFLDKNYSLTHLNGCNYNVRFNLNNKTNFSLNVGEMIDLGNFNLLLNGATCRKGKPIKVRIQKLTKNKCNNNYCEAGENEMNCPWDCMDIKPISSNLSPINTLRCTSGCYYDHKCLAQDSTLKYNNKTFKCDKSTWKSIKAN